MEVMGMISKVSEFHVNLLMSKDALRHGHAAGSSTAFVYTQLVVWHWHRSHNHVLHLIPTSIAPMLLLRVSSYMKSIGYSLTAVYRLEIVGSIR